MEAGRLRRWHVERLGFAVQTGSFGSHRQAALAGADDLRDELFTVDADLHGDPVLCQLFGQLQFVLRLPVSAAVPGQPANSEKCYNSAHQTFFCLCRRSATTFGVDCVCRIPAHVSLVLLVPKLHELHC